MPEGLVRTDSNKGGASFRDGQPVTLPKNFGIPVTLPKNFGTTIPVADPTLNSNPVDWQTPAPAHFGNTIAPPTPAPTFDSITPDNGTDLGGDPVTIAGTGFLTGATVTIGGASATSVVVVSDIEITAVTPAGSDGAQDVVVTNTDVQDTGTEGAGAFTYVAPAGAPTVVQNSTPNFISSGAPSVAFDAPTVAGNTIVVFMSVWFSGTVTSITDDQGNTYTLVGHTSIQGGLSASTFCYICTSATPVTTVSWVSTQTRGMASIIEVTPATVDAFVASAGAVTMNTANNPITAEGPVVATTADLILALFTAINGAGAVCTEGTGYTLVATQDDTTHFGAIILVEQKTVAAGSYGATMTVNANAGDGNSFLLALKA